MKKIIKPQIPENIRVYCIGDIHGRIDLLISMHNKITLDSFRYQGKKIVIYLGDYIDRGLHSKEVIDNLLSKPLADFEAIHLRGNHEQVLLDFLDIDSDHAMDWLYYGGLATCLSYGISLTGIPIAKEIIQLQQGLTENIPDSHFSFYKHLHHYYELGDYFFVHAGINPKVPLSKQSKLEMLWIRDEFLNSKKPHEKIIVHGHTVTNSPVVLPNRIGIDTGAFSSGILTCLILEGDQQRFLATNS